MISHQSGEKWNHVCLSYFEQEYFEKSELLIIVNRDRNKSRLPAKTDWRDRLAGWNKMKFSFLAAYKLFFLMIEYQT